MLWRRQFVKRQKFSKSVEVGSIAAIELEKEDGCHKHKELKSKIYESHFLLFIHLPKFKLFTHSQ